MYGGKYYVSKRFHISARASKQTLQYLLSVFIFLDLYVFTRIILFLWRKGMAYSVGYLLDDRESVVSPW